MIDLQDCEQPLADLYLRIDDRAADLSTVDLQPLLASFALVSESPLPVDLGRAGPVLSLGSELCFAKSRALLPNVARESAPEHRRLENTDPLDLTAAAEAMRATQGQIAFAAPNRLHAVEPIREPRSSALLQRAWRDMQKRNSPIAARVAAPSFVRLEVALSRLIRRLGSSRRLSLSSLLRGATRQDAVIHFLAVLEMLRRRQVAAVQLDLFGDIALEVPQDSEDQTEHDKRVG